MRTPLPRTGAILLFLLVSACATTRATGATRLIHKATGEHYSVYVVEDEQGLRYLRFEPDGVNQSAVRLGEPTYLKFPYARAVLAAVALHPAPRSVLVVGLGGGSIPMFLRAQDPSMAIDIVEIDPLVADVAQSHMGFVPDSRMRVHVADGRRFIEQGADGSYDVIILDAYGSDSIPMSLATREFLESVRARLAPGGLVASNVWGQRYNRHYADMVATYEAVFPEVVVIRATDSESRIVAAHRGRDAWSHTVAVQRARQLMERWSLGFDLAGIVQRGFVRRPGGLSAARARVLQDPKTQRPEAP